ncbi:MAG TPA: hypothetical protein DCE39_01475 [Planctomycetaceae bacterium]|jgi:hypothetical protein|nr:hypothetical protein [Planctomycetaceae bacterium]MCH2588494.1 hypothetical protein [Planctomycetales bacterium]GIS58021.1 MAG: hypothetical protein CM1200mP2_02460 [Planctomycetaceae bacterium]HAA59585.1 hypothetical protein [Planctomycetaceae bacterium]|tara:strand:- start:1695 stop:1883 length:189 start_codon:yes stop_codon:yes gene_type:complete
MGLNRKQKKQLEVARKKVENLRQQLAGAKTQPDDPADIPRLEAEIEQNLEKIRSLKRGGDGK